MLTTSNGSPDPLLRLRRVTKQYATPSGPFTALRALDLEVRAGELVAVVGKSGSGKSTLLNLLAGIDRATSGEIIVAGTPVHALPESALAAWRGRAVGIVFQSFQLLPTLTAAENVILPMDFLGARPAKARRAHALALLAQVGIAEQADKLPSALSAGQQQRAAIARAIANDPPLVLADEPTGNLDSATADAVLAVFAALVARGTTVVMVTHERDVSRFASRTIALADGALVPDAVAGAPSGAPREVAHA
ncbi:MAG: ABC transporter ATP-binding protein [Deltaproteobacteria bacterium]|nr:ABC transporter ATP-binding protein [Deltaproteobacteria bacterium]